MRSVLVRRLGAIALLFALALGAYLLGEVAAHNGLDWADKASSVASFFVALVALAVPTFRRVSRWLSRAPLADVGVPQAMEDLAIALRRRLANEERLRKVNDPRPLPVRWDVTAPPREDLAGHYEQVLEMFDRLPARRLVVLGPGGAGKSVLITRLARDLLETRCPGKPVPVIIPMATWDTEDPLDDWLTGQLVSDHPGLGAHVRLATGDTISLAGALLARGGILPLLDGLDELPAALRQRAVAAVNAHGSDQPLVLTSRPEEYREAVAAAGRAVSMATVVELRPLRLPEAVDYLSEATARPERWRPVFDRLAREPDGPLVEVLTNPLMLWLARTVHGLSDSDPAPLAADNRDRAALEAHLLDAFVPAVYGRASRGRRAERWLAFLAAHLQRTGTPELAWWRLTRALRGWFAIDVGIRVAIRATAAWAVLAWLLAQHGYWRDGAFAGRNAGDVDLLEVFLGGPVGQRLVPVLDATFDWAKVPAYIVDDAFSAMRPGIASWLAFGLGLLAAAFVIVVTSTDPTIMDRQPVTLRLQPLRLLRAIAAHVLGFSLLLLATGGFVLYTATSEDPDTIERALAGESLWTLLPWVLLFAVTTWSAPVVQPVDVSRAVSSPEVLRLDRRAFLLKVVVDTARTALLFGLIGGRLVVTAYLGYAALALVLRFTVGTPAIINTYYSASQSYADARFWLAVTGRLPWRTMAFLSGAHQRGVLRQIGAAYQFRHLRLQEHLAAKHPPWADRFAPYTARLVRWLAPVERLHSAADTEARAAGLTVEHAPWGTQRFRDPGLRGRLEHRRVAGNLVADDETRAAVRRAEALAARLDRLSWLVRLRAKVLRIAMSARAARRFVSRQLDPGDGLEDFRWTGREIGPPMPSEEIPAAAVRQHPVWLAPPALVTAGLAFLFSYLAAIGAGLPIGVVAVPLLVSALWLLKRFLDWRASGFLVTNRRLMLVYEADYDRSGRWHVEVPLAEVADVSCIQSLLGALLGYGRLHVNTVDGCLPVRYARWAPPWGPILDLGRWEVELPEERSFRPTAAVRRPLSLLRLVIAELDQPSNDADQPIDAWVEIAALIDARRPRQYDAAVDRLKQLRAADERNGDGEEFRTRLCQLRRDHARKSSLLKRLDDAGL